MTPTTVNDNMQQMFLAWTNSSVLTGNLPLGWLVEWNDVPFTTPCYPIADLVDRQNALYKSIPKMHTSCITFYAVINLLWISNNVQQNGNLCNNWHSTQFWEHFYRNTAFYIYAGTMHAHDL